MVSEDNLGADAPRTKLQGRLKCLHSQALLEAGSEEEGGWGILDSGLKCQNLDNYPWREKLKTGVLEFIHRFLNKY